MQRARWPLRFLGVISFLAVGFTATSTLGGEGNSPADGFTLHIQAPHMMPDGTVGGPFHHYCKGISDEIIQCLLFESTDPKGRLIGVEYFIAKALVRKEIPLITWNRNFHDHKVEIATGRVLVLDQPEEKAKEIAEAASGTDGIIFHLWPKGKKVPDGTVVIPNAVGHKFRTK